MLPSFLPFCRTLPLLVIGSYSPTNSLFILAVLSFKPQALCEDFLGTDITTTAQNLLTCLACYPDLEHTFYVTFIVINCNFPGVLSLPLDCEPFVVFTFVTPAFI